VRTGNEAELKTDEIQVVPIDPAGKYLLILEGFDGHTEELEQLRTGLWEWMSSDEVPFFVICVRQGTIRLEKVEGSND